MPGRLDIDLFKLRFEKEGKSDTDPWRRIISGVT